MFLLHSNGLKTRQTSVSSAFLQISFRIDGGNGVEKVISTGRRSEKIRGRRNVEDAEDGTMERGEEGEEE